MTIVIPGWLWPVLLWFGVHWAYVLVMAAKDAMQRGKLTLYWKVHLVPAAVVGVVLDLMFNGTFGWLMFAEAPWGRGLMFSARVQYHFRHGSGWRKRLSQFWARNLNVFDDHIRPLFGGDK